MFLLSSATLFNTLVAYMGDGGDGKRASHPKPKQPAPPKLLIKKRKSHFPLRFISLRFIVHRKSSLQCHRINPPHPTRVATPRRPAARPTIHPAVRAPFPEAEGMFSKQHHAVIAERQTKDLARIITLSPDVQRLSFRLCGRLYDYHISRRPLLPLFPLTVVGRTPGTTTGAAAIRTVHTPVRINGGGKRWVARVLMGNEAPIPWEAEHSARRLAGPLAQ